MLSSIVASVEFFFTGVVVVAAVAVVICLYERCIVLDFFANRGLAYCY